MSNARPRLSKRLGRVVPAGLAAATTAVAGMAVLAQPASALTPPLPVFASSFRTGQSLPFVWKATNPKGPHQPCLTAKGIPLPGSLPTCTTGTPDPKGKGAFQLTNNDKDEAGSLLLQVPQKNLAGSRFEFDMFNYNTKELRNGKGADGISFFLVDGSQKNSDAGAPGGSLGYTGVKGAIVGIGFDEYGNFSKPDSGKGGPGLAPNSVVVRGAETTGYQYLTGATSPAPLGVPSAKTRDAAKRHVVVTISPKSVLAVTVDYNDGKGQQVVIRDIDLKNIPGQPTLPKLYKLGFAASSGQGTNNHEIRDFKISKFI